MTGKLLILFIISLGFLPYFSVVAPGKRMSLILRKDKNYSIKARTNFQKNLMLFILQEALET